MYNDQTCSLIACRSGLLGGGGMGLERMTKNMRMDSVEQWRVTLSRTDQVHCKPGNQSTKTA